VPRSDGLNERGENHQAETNTMLPVRLLFGVAVLNLLFLFTELGVNIVRAFIG